MIVRQDLKPLFPDRPYTDIALSVEQVQELMNHAGLSSRLMGTQDGKIIVRVFTAKGIDHAEAIDTLLESIEENHV